MTIFKFKRLGKLSRNTELPPSATHYFDDDGEQKAIEMARPGELLFYYLLGEHKDLYLGRIGVLKLPHPMPLHLERHLGGKLPAPKGKGMTRAMARAVMDDVVATHPELSERMARYFALL